MVIRKLIRETEIVHKNYLVIFCLFLIDFVNKNVDNKEVNL